MSTQVASSLRRAATIQARQINLSCLPVGISDIN